MPNIGIMMCIIYIGVSIMFCMCVEIFGVYVSVDLLYIQI